MGEVIILTFVFFEGEAAKPFTGRNAIIVIAVNKYIALLFISDTLLVEIDFGLEALGPGQAPKLECPLSVANVK